MKQKYITIPLAMAYWTLPFFVEFTSDGMSGFIIFGAMLSIGALSDLDK